MKGLFSLQGLLDRASNQFIWGKANSIFAVVGRKVHFPCGNFKNDYPSNQICQTPIYICCSCSAEIVRSWRVLTRFPQCWASVSGVYNYFVFVSIIYYGQEGRTHAWGKFAQGIILWIFLSCRLSSSGWSRRSSCVSVLSIFASTHFEDGSARICSPSDRQPYLQNEWLQNVPGWHCDEFVQLFFLRVVSLTTRQSFPW